MRRRSVEYVKAYISSLVCNYGPRSLVLSVSAQVQIQVSIHHANDISQIMAKTISDKDNPLQ
jgi:hypothetical protein